jgi:poly(beta-D-mannuronate) lyase
VYGNWFFGNKKKNTGGVRIIGENHRVYDNWFQELGGGDRYSPLAVMDGVKDTPLNGYYQVKNAVISKNIFVGCARGIVLGVRNNDYSGFVPADTLTITQNVFYRVASPLVVNSKPNAPFYSGNIVCEGSGTLSLGFEAKTFDAPDSALLFQFLREDNRSTSVRIPVIIDDVGASWLKK